MAKRDVLENPCKHVLVFENENIFVLCEIFSGLTYKIYRKLGNTIRGD